MRGIAHAPSKVRPLWTDVTSAPTNLVAAAVKLWPSLSASLKAPITKTRVQRVIIALMRTLPGEDAVFLAGRLGAEEG